MAIYVYITDQCRKEIAQQNYATEIKSFRKKVETTQSLEVFDRFPPPFLKKRFERQIRLVSREVILEEHTVVVFLRLLVRGGKEYKQFGDAGYKELPGFEGMAKEISVESLTAYVLGCQDPLPPPPPPPDEEESLFLHSALNSDNHIYTDAHCCETKLWVDTITSSDFKDWKPYFIQAVLETCDHDGRGLQEIRCQQDPNYGILFRRIPEEKMVILFTPFRGEAPKQLIQNRYADLLVEEAPSHQSVLRKTKRAYPHELVLIPPAWLAVQNDLDGNMALSVEEVEVLESARHNSGGFPLFINGSAGSGKSTILQYLFAEYLFHHFQSGKRTAGPVLFACNDELLARSGTSIRSILRARLGRNESTPNADSWLKSHESDLDSSLLNFHAWLRRKAPEKFPEDMLVDYARFKQWWEDRFKADPGARKLYDADVSWHVIRTYIKGISMDDVLDPEDYLEIPAKQKSVTPDTYRVVFDVVWKRYKEDQKAKGFWDHQDLARYVLENELAQPDYPAVFCDEAQDFTRLELEVLHRCCLFNARTLNSYELPKVPIAFAGDPFQTLNPTGFRWEATKAFFTDKFIKNYPGQKRGEINYQELSYNYRSSHHIVRFINSLQLVRSVVFGFPEIKPQHPWEDDEKVPRVVYFNRTPETLSQLKKQSEIRIVVPCEAGFEGQWAKDNGLADYVQFDEAGVPKNVVSSVGVKGLEFPRVVLFGFGAACPKLLRNVLDRLAAGGQEELPEMRDDHAIEPQYFWNRLYVAASRPRKRLFIVDDAADIKGFWNPIFTSLDDTILRSDDVARWENVLGQLIQGDDSAWEGDQEDAEETGKRLETEGRLRKDRTMLRQAALSFRDAKLFDAEKRCKAQALELESNHLAAAKLWHDLKQADQALFAAWNARDAGLEFMVLLGDAYPQLKNDVHWKVAHFLRINGSLSDGVSLISDVADSVNEPKLQEEILMSGVWPHMLMLVVRALLVRDDKDSGRWSIAYRHARTLLDKGVQLAAAELGDLAFRGEQMQQAHDHWASVPIEQRTSYEGRFLLAKASVSPYPQKLETFGDILRRNPDPKLANEVLELVHREGSDKLTDQQAATVVQASLLTSNLTEAFNGMDRVRDQGLLYTVWAAADKAGQSREASRVVGRIAQLLCDQEDWQGFADFFTKGTLSQVAAKGLPESVRRFPIEHSCPILAILAESAAFEHASNDVKTRVADVLASRFPVSLGWRHSIHPLVVGRALERAGLFRASLPFYEAVANFRGVSKELRRSAWGRWIRIKVQQVAVQGNRKGLEDAKEKAATYGFGTPDNVPVDLPNPLPPVDEAQEALASKKAPQTKSAKQNVQPMVDNTDETAVNISPSVAPLSEKASPGDFARTLPLGSLEIRVMPDGRRVNVTHGATGQVLSIFTLKRSASLDGDPVEFGSDGKLDSLPEDWGLQVSFERLKQGKLDFNTRDGMEFALPVQAVSP
jgi:hypothetical protein